MNIIDGIYYGDTLSERGNNLIFKYVKQCFIKGNFDGDKMIKYMSSILLTHSNDNINMIIDIYDNNDELEWFQCTFSKDLQFDIITDDALARNGVIVELTLKKDIKEAFTQTILQTISSHSNCVSVFCSFIHTLWLRRLYDHTFPEHLSVYDVYHTSISHWNDYITHKMHPIIYKWFQFINNYKKKTHLHFTYCVIFLFSRLCDMCEGTKEETITINKITSDVFIERMKRCFFKDIHGFSIKHTDCIKSLALMFWLIEWSRSEQSYPVERLPHGVEELPEKKMECITWVTLLNMKQGNVGAICGSGLSSMWRKT